MRERRYYVQVSHINDIMKNCGLFCLCQVIAISLWKQTEISTEYPNFNVTTLADSS